MALVATLSTRKRALWDSTKEKLCGKAPFLSSSLSSPLHTNVTSWVGGWGGARCSIGRTGTCNAVVREFSFARSFRAHASALSTHLHSILYFLFWLSVLKNCQAQIAMINLTMKLSHVKKKQCMH